MDKLLSVGLDVGTTTTQLIVSQLQVENRATGFAVPQMEITSRQIRYRGPVHMTPLADAAHVDGEALRCLVEKEYTAAGIDREAVDTGAIIITGETSRKENARRVLQALSEYAGAFVVATAGPHLESVLAARGAGAVEYSAKTGKTVLHMDIGGGTSNLALIREGKIRIQRPTAAAFAQLLQGTSLEALRRQRDKSAIHPPDDRGLRASAGCMAQTRQSYEEPRPRPSRVRDIRRRNPPSVRLGTERHPQLL